MFIINQLIRRSIFCFLKLYWHSLTLINYCWFILDQYSCQPVPAQYRLFYYLFMYDIFMVILFYLYTAALIIMYLRRSFLFLYVSIFFHRRILMMDINHLSPYPYFIVTYYSAAYRPVTGHHQFSSYFIHIIFIFKI